MPLTPTPILTTIAQLLDAESRISQLVLPAFQPDQASGSTQKRAVRVRYELNNARGLLQQLRSVLERLVEIPAQRKELVDVRQLAAVLGAGGLVFSHLEKGLRELGVLSGGGGDEDPDVLRRLRHDAKGEVWDMLRGLQDFGTSTWFVLTTLESPSNNDVASSCENLRSAVVEILGKDNELSREIKRLYPDPGQGDTLSLLDGSRRSNFEAIGILYSVDDSDDSDDGSGPPTPSSSEFPSPNTPPEPRLANLSDVSDLETILIPLANPEEVLDSTDKELSWAVPQLITSHLEVVTVSGASVDFASLRQLCDPEDTASLPYPDTAVSAHAVFEVGEVVDKVVLDFFRRAVNVSRFAARLSDDIKISRLAKRGYHEANEKMARLTQQQFRELTTDVYDELVRRNVEDKNTRTRVYGAPQVLLEHPDGCHPKRVKAREKLRGLTDGPMAHMLASVFCELERRILVEESATPTSRITSMFNARLSTVQGQR